MSSRKDTRAIKLASVATLKPSVRNARVHPEKQLRALARSIKKFGFNSPILINEAGEVLCGHGRLEAAKRVGLVEVPTLRIDHLTPDEQRAFMLADNKLSDLGRWDRETLDIEFQHLLSVGFELELTGFAAPEIDGVLSEASERRGEPDEDDKVLPADRNAPAVTGVGDLWSFGSPNRPHHRLLCGDSRQARCLATLMGPDRASMLLTDPPYNVRISGHVSGKGRVKHPEFAMASGEMTEPQFIEFLASFLREALEVSAEDAIAYVFMCWQRGWELQSAARSLELRPINLAVWNKSNGGMGSLYRSKHELIFIFGRKQASSRNNVELGKHGRSRTNVWDYAGVNAFGKGRAADLERHPTVKPVALLADAIRDVTITNEIILDPFGGSGSTLIAAHRVGRQARLIELDPHYCDQTVRRWQAMTGRQVFLRETGEAFDMVAERRAAASMSASKLPRANARRRGAST